MLFDVAKAFDKVWHQPLTVKLHRAHVPPTLTPPINSYLADRTFKVKINDALSQS